MIPASKASRIHLHTCKRTSLHHEDHTTFIIIIHRASLITILHEKKLQSHPRQVCLRRSYCNKTKQVYRPRNHTAYNDIAEKYYSCDICYNTWFGYRMRVASFSYITTIFKHKNIFDTCHNYSLTHYARVLLEEKIQSSWHARIQTKRVYASLTRVI